jgi:hypothetical protein
MSATEPTPKQPHGHHLPADAFPPPQPTRPDQGETETRPLPQPYYGDQPPQPYSAQQPQPYSAQQPQQYYGPPRPTSGLAITALVLGILGGAIFAVLFGHLALNDIKTTGKDGKGMAIAGLVLGYIETAFWALIIIIFIAAAAGSGL